MPHPPVHGGGPFDAILLLNGPGTVLPALHLPDRLQFEGLAITNCCHGYLVFLIPKYQSWFEDKGIGIEKQYHDKIWQMFQQLNKSYEGTGIGLALVRKVVDRMGGKVGVESEPGHGSRFWVELKRVNGQPHPKPLTPDLPQ